MTSACNKEDRNSFDRCLRWRQHVTRKIGTRSIDVCDDVSMYRTRSSRSDVSNSAPAIASSTAVIVTYASSTEQIASASFASSIGNNDERFATDEAYVTEAKLVGTLSSCTWSFAAFAPFIIAGSRNINDRLVAGVIVVTDETVANLANSWQRNLK